MRRIFNLKVILFLFVCVGVYGVLHSQPIRKRILGSIELTHENSEVRVSVSFNFPVRYISHFPAEKGKELRVKLEPIVAQTLDRGFISERESAPIPPVSDGENILEITYEGDIEGGPYLTFLFREETHFFVEQGEDFRSLIVRVIKESDFERRESGGGGNRK